MSWINEHRRAWRTAVLLLAAVALIGPWAFDRISVPAEYACSPPNVRLDGEFCGTPLPGLLTFLWVITGILELVRALTLTELDWALQLLSFLCALTLSLLPLLTTFILILDESRRFRFQAAAWGLAAILGPILALTILSKPRSALWGIWLYTGLAVGALVLELSTFVAGRRPSLEGVDHSDGPSR